MPMRFDELKITNQLPSPTGVALAVLRLGESDDQPMLEIARVMQSDPALCGRLLKIANSASMARGRPATSVNEALTLLGFRTVRSIALGFSLVSQHCRGPCQGFDYNNFWSHSLAMGIAAQAAANRLGGIAPHEAFTCGLLAQVGRLALASVYPEVYSEILAQIESGNPDDLRGLELRHFAMDHQEMTGALLRDWRLPEDCVHAVERFDLATAAVAPATERVLLLVRLLQLAAQIADACLSGAVELSEQQPELLSVGEGLGIQPTGLRELYKGVVRDWRDWGAIFEVETVAAPPCTELLERARAAGQSAKPQESIEDLDAEGRLKIIVVDDDAVALRVLVWQLVKAGHSVQSAANGNEGLSLVLAEAPQLVITDYQMPGMDGAALTRALRQTKMGRQLYVIMLTGSEEDETQVEAFAAGADDYVVKPVRPRLLAARLRACARVVHLQGEIRREKEELRRCMAELGVANRKLQQAAQTDVLTGLYNRRFAMDCLDEKWNESIRAGTPLACMIIDIDHFKRVNDTHGHDVGDRVLQATAELLSSKMRQTDVICRLGGEEFLVIGGNMDAQTALDCAERLCASVAAQGIETTNGHLSVTVSIGVAARSVSMQSTAELLKAADQAVYLAKALGRNQVRCEATLNSPASNSALARMAPQSYT